MKRLLFLTLLLSLGFFSLSQPVLGANDNSYGLKDTAEAADLDQYNTPVPELIGNIIGTALSMISVVFFILAIYGGFRMMFARGKDDEFTKGKDILIHAIIGMIVILASYAITQFVFDSVKEGVPQDIPPQSPEKSCKITSSIVNKCAGITIVAECNTDSDCSSVSNSSGGKVCVPTKTLDCSQLASESACTAAESVGCEWL